MRFALDFMAGVVPALVFYGAVILIVRAGSRRTDRERWNFWAVPDQRADWGWVLLAVPLALFNAGAAWLVWYGVSSIIPSAGPWVWN